MVSEPRSRSNQTFSGLEVLEQMLNYQQQPATSPQITQKKEDQKGADKDCHALISTVFEPLINSIPSCLWEGDGGADSRMHTLCAGTHLECVPHYSAHK